LNRPLWRALDAWPAHERPVSLWPFIAETGSLTEKLRAKAGDAFRFRLLSESAHALAADDAALLGVTQGAQGFLRQVDLGGAEPWVYARSLAAGEGVDWLKALGQQPLGQRVFGQRDTTRGPIQVARLAPGDGLLQAAAASRGRPLQELWARRSVLKAGGTAILIYEFFYPELGG